MTQEDKDYLLWRCKTSWHNKYHHYINEWINNVIPTQLEYFRKEMNNLINRGIYKPMDLATEVTEENNLYENNN